MRSRNCAATGSINASAAARLEREPEPGDPGWTAAEAAHPADERALAHRARGARSHPAEGGGGSADSGDDGGDDGGFLDDVGGFFSEDVPGFFTEDVPDFFTEDIPEFFTNDFFTGAGDFFVGLGGAFWEDVTGIGDSLGALWDDPGQWLSDNLGALGDLGEAKRIAAVRCSDHKHPLAIGCDRLDRGLAI